MGRSARWCPTMEREKKRGGGAEAPMKGGSAHHMKKRQQNESWRLACGTACDTTPGLEKRAEHRVSQCARGCRCEEEGGYRKEGGSARTLFVVRAVGGWVGGGGGEGGGTGRAVYAERERARVWSPEECERLCVSSYVNKTHASIVSRFFSRQERPARTSRRSRTNNTAAQESERGFGGCVWGDGETLSFLHITGWTPG